MNYQYKMVPFMAKIKEGQMAASIATQIQEVVATNTQSGEWEFYRIDSIATIVKPGCLSELFGGKATQISYPVITFRKS